jgi:probable DNA repair protein
VDAPWLLELARGPDPGAAHACRQLAVRLADWLPLALQARAQRQLPSDWSVAFLALLAALGWPGERTLSSDEYQTWAKLREVVSDLTHLDAVLGRLRLGEALTWLAQLCAQTLFQPEAEARSVQILGSLESVGLEFDHLFVTGLHDEAWPEPARPNPFLPVAMQRAHGVPHSSAQWELAFARRMTELWRGAAPDVIFSHPTREADRVLRASPLIADLEPAQATEMTPDYARALRSAARLEQVADGIAPALPDGFEAPGGVAVFENQAACPFRAFAVHRLGAQPLEEGRPALDARERGTLLHRALAGLWGELQAQEQLLALSAEAATGAVERAVDGALAWMRGRRPDALGPAFAALERERLIHLLGRLLELERTRAPFRVLSLESPRMLDLGGLRAHGKVDRIDALGDGRHAVIDYKTGQAGVGQWRDARPDAPQLPLYAVTDPGEVAALAFAVLRPDGVEYRGLACDPGLLPGVAPPDPPLQWQDLIPRWRETLAALAREFLTGHAAVSPKRYPHTCAYCDVAPLCRVRELFDRGPVSGDDGAADRETDVERADD